MNQNQSQTAIPAAAVENTYFNSVMYARAYINEVKLVESKKKGAKPYCAINASIIEAGADGNKIYRTIDLIVRGKPAKEVLQRFRDRWPADRTKREANPWLADVNIGSIHAESYRKRDGSTAAVLKGRLLNIRAADRAGNCPRRFCRRTAAARFCSPVLHQRNPPRQGADESVGA